MGIRETLERKKIKPGMEQAIDAAPGTRYFELNFMYKLGSHWVGWAARMRKSELVWLKDLANMKYIGL